MYPESSSNGCTFTLTKLNKSEFVHTVSVLRTLQCCIHHCITDRISSMEAKEKYRGMFETQKSGNKTSSGEIGLDIRTHASPKMGQDQVSGGVSVLCCHAAPVANVGTYGIQHSSGIL